MNNSPDTIENEENDLQLNPFLKICYTQFLRHWAWFLVSVIICLILSWLYYQRQPRIYQRQSVMLIEDATDEGATGVRKAARGNMSGLLELNGISVGNNLKNEIFILSSQRIMTRVAKKLQLDVDYVTKAGLHQIALYKNERPFVINFLDSLKGDRGVRINVTKADGSKLRLDGFTDKEGKELPAVTVVPGDIVNTPAGRLCVVRGSRFGKWNGQEITVTRQSVQNTAGTLSQRIAVSNYDKEASLIVLTYKDMNPQRAEDILNTVVDTYKEDVVENKNRVALNTARFIDERIRLIGAELNEVENNLADFKKRNKVVDFESSAQAIMQESSSARQKSLLIETQLNVARYLYDYLNSNTNARSLIPVLNIGEAAFNNPIDQYNKLMAERNETAANTSENHPVIREMDKKLEQMRQNIKESVANHISTCEVRLRDARNDEQMLTGRMSGAPEQEKLGLDIKRQQALKEALYTYLLNKREEVALKQAINEANVRVVEGPIGSRLPVSPRSYILLLGLLIGLLIPAVVIWIIMSLDVSVRGRKDVEELTTIPLLGEVPSVKGSDNNTLISDLATDDPIVEGFRIMRFNMGYLRCDTQVMLATSTTPRQGKSFISRNLAVILAMAGKKVLIIDADVRKGTLSRHSNLLVGLTTYLADEHTRLDEVVMKDGFQKGIDLLPAGPMPPNPSELLMSPRLDEMIAELRKRYDHIIIDSTPLFAVADANIVNRVADMTLFIIRARMQHRDFLPELERMYRDNRFKNLAIVLNDVKGNDRKNGYGYGYGYGYGKEQRKQRTLNILKRLRG